jgi:beta-glucosidase
MSRLEFPPGFHWGCATAAYQIEGAVHEGSRGESIWDRFAHTPGKIRTGETGDVACDSYHRFGDDIALLREMGCTSYRFSISWPRIQGAGKGRPNAEGLAYYERLIDGLLAAGIRPFPTLYHWDLPQALEDRGGWPARDTAYRFAEYAHHVVRSLGDRVPDWMIFNEPGIFTFFGYGIGIHAPGVANRHAMLRATHVVNLAQGEAFRAIREERTEARIGSAFSFQAMEPASDSSVDVDAAERMHAWTNEWFLRPTLRGSYPEHAFEEGVPDALEIQEGDLERIQVPLDFVGVNLYSRGLVRAQANDPWGWGARVLGMGGDAGPKTDFGWEVWPNSLQDLLVRLDADYDSPVFEITENGCSFGDVPDSDGKIADLRRIAFFRGYLSAVHRAIAAGVDVRGYHAWTLLDNFEWAEGTAQRFGVAFTDFATGDRTLKQSGHWFARVIDQNGFDPEGEGEQA